MTATSNLPSEAVATSLSAPQVPNEIFASIIDEVAHLQTPEDKLQDVKSCRLVCNAFAKLGRTHIFRELYWSMRLPANGKIYSWDRFFEILDRDPSIAIHVRKLTFQCWTLVQVEKHTRYLEALLRLPNLQTLKVMNWGSSERPEVDQFRRRLIDMILASGTLKCLDVEHVQDLPFNKLSTCPTLTSLRLGGCDIQALAAHRTEALQNITSLELRDYEVVPVSIIFQAKKIDELTLLNIIHLAPLGSFSPEHCCPSRQTPSGITKLSLYIKESSVLIDAMIAQTVGCECKPFENLQDLEFGIFNQANIECFKTLLPKLSALRSLSVSVRSGTPGFSFADLQLRTHNISTFRLKSLSLTFPYWAGDAIYSELLDQLHSFFEGIASRNQLEDIRLNIDTEMMLSASNLNRGGRRLVVVPSSNPWSRIDKVLAPNSKFPKLRTVDIKLRFSGMEDSIMDEIDSTPGMGQSFKDYLKNSMPMLAHMDSGVNFIAEVDLTG